VREEYFGPVGFAKEPAEERKRWFGRILTLLFVIAIVLLFYYRVLTPPSTDNPQVPTQTELPGPR
jgi:hypothetical protein